MVNLESSFMSTLQQQAWAQMQQGHQVIPDCAACPRLVALRQQLRRDHPRWHNAPINGFGDEPAHTSLLVLGLAPGMKGANRTGRPFTGDGAGVLLYQTLQKFDFARGHYAEGEVDNLQLQHCRIVNAVRCLPPQNKPTTSEIHNCQQHLVKELALMPQLQVVIALGLVAHRALLHALGLSLGQYPFTHGAEHNFLINSQSQQRIVLLDSYHCSRYNTNTKRLTANMFEAVFQRARSLVSHG